MSPKHQFVCGLKISKLVAGIGFLFQNCFNLISGKKKEKQICIKIDWIVLNCLCWPKFLFQERVIISGLSGPFGAQGKQVNVEEKVIPLISRMCKGKQKVFRNSPRENSQKSAVS